MKFFDQSDEHKTTHLSTAQVAEQALKYARAHIQKGTTQIDNNAYEEEQKKALDKAIHDIRTLAREYPQCALEIDQSIHQFYQFIHLCKKFSLGNCHELAFMALDYVINEPAAKHIDAEVYHIDGGDHVILVIGRNKNSDPKNPKTWGDDAYICDPWANKFYPAKDYLTELGNYYSYLDNDKKRINKTAPFNPSFHTLEPIKKQNTMHIRQSNSDEHVKQICNLFQEKSNGMITSLETLKDKLNHISNKLSKKYGDQDPKKIALQNTIDELNTAIETIQSSLKNIDHQGKYLDYRKKLENTLCKNIVTSKNVLTQTRAQTTPLYEHRNRDSLKTQLLQFFGIQPTSAKSTYKAIEKSEEEMGKILNKK